MIDKHLTTDGNKVDILKSKVHLTQRLLEDKHDETQDTNTDLLEKRRKFNQAESEFYDKK